MPRAPGPPARWPLPNAHVMLPSSSHQEEGLAVQNDPPFRTADYTSARTVLGKHGQWQGPFGEGRGGHKLARGSAGIRTDRTLELTSIFEAAKRLRGRAHQRGGRHGKRFDSLEQNGRGNATFSLDHDSGGKRLAHREGTAFEGGGSGQAGKSSKMEVSIRRRVRQGLTLSEHEATSRIKGSRSDASERRNGLKARQEWKEQKQESPNSLLGSRPPRRAENARNALKLAPRLVPGWLLPVGKRTHTSHCHRRRMQFRRIVAGTSRAAAAVPVDADNTPSMLNDTGTLRDVASASPTGSCPS